MESFLQLLSFYFNQNYKIPGQFCIFDINITKGSKQKKMLNRYAKTFNETLNLFDDIHKSRTNVNFARFHRVKVNFILFDIDFERAVFK